MGHLDIDKSVFPNSSLDRGLCIGSTFYKLLQLFAQFYDTSLTFSQPEFRRYTTPQIWNSYWTPI